MEVKLEKGEYVRLCEIVQKFMDECSAGPHNDVNFPSKADSVVNDILQYLAVN